MGLFERMFRRSRPGPSVEAQPAPAGEAEPEPPGNAGSSLQSGTGLSPAEYVRTRSPREDPLEDLVEILRLWQNSAPVPPDASRVTAFVASFARDWRTRTASGSAAQALDWFERCARSDVASDAGTGCIVRGLESVSFHWGRVAFDGTPEGWHRFGVAGSAIELGVGGAYHVIARVSEREFAYAGHG